MERATEPILRVDENVTKYQFVSGKSGKMFSFLSQGWMSFVDERDEQSYTKIFEIFPDNDNHPDDNSNFEIYSSGGNYIELEVLSPIETIDGGGDSISYDEYWYAAKVNGAIRGANHAGIIRRKLNFDKSSGHISGEFGIFNNGSLRIVYFDKDNQEVGSMDAIPVNATEKYTLSTDHFLARKYRRNQDSGLRCGKQFDRSTRCSLSGSGYRHCRHPFIRALQSISDPGGKGNAFYHSNQSCPGEDITVEIHSLADGREAGTFVFPGNSDRLFCTNRLPGNRNLPCNRTAFGDGFQGEDDYPVSS